MALTELVQKFTSVEAAMSSFSRRAYFFQQAAQVATFALVGLAAAASGPLLAGLTILGTSLITVAGGFGLVALAAAPIISHFANAEQNATKLKSAQDSLKASTEALKNAQESLADAQAGVAEAARSGRESITNAIKAHGDAARAVTEAEKTGHEQITAAIQAHKDAMEATTEAERQAREGVRSAIDAQKSALDSLRSAEDAHTDATEEAEEATEAVAEATRDYTDALATEQFRLQSMRYDLEGMAISQKQLALDIKEAEKELQKADSPQEREEAELRLQELQLQRKQNTLEQAEAQRELNEAEKEGTDELQSAAESRKDALDAQAEANDGVRDSLEGVRDAEKDVLMAEKDVERARREGWRMVNEAVRAERQAQAAITTARKEAAAQVREAQREEREAYAAIGKARQDAGRQMAEALKQVARAQEDVADAAKQVKADQSAVNALLNSTAGYLKPLIAAVGRFKEQYKTSFAGANQATANLGTQLVKTATAQLPSLGQAAERTANRLSIVFARLGNEFKKFGALKSFRSILNQMPGITGKWTSAIGRFGGAFLNIMRQSMPFVRQFASWVNKTALNFLKWTNSEHGRKQIQKFFQSAAPVAKTLWNWILKIGGAILKWSIHHPKELAAVFKMIGQLLMFIVKASIWVMNQLFKIAAAEHPWRRLGLTILGIRAALFIVGAGFGVLKMIAIRALAGLIGWMGRGFVAGIRGVFSSALLIARAWMAGNITTVTFGVLRMLSAFAMLARVTFVFAFIIAAVKAAWNEIGNHTFQTIQGLYSMWKNGSLSIGGVILNVFRQVFASLVQIAGEAFIGVVAGAFRMVRSLMNLFPGNIGDRIFGGIDKAQKDLVADFRKSTDNIRGETNKQAELVGKNYNKMSSSGGKETEQLKDSTSKDMMDIKAAMIKNTQEGGNQGKSNLNSFEKDGSASLKSLMTSGTGDLKNLNQTGSFNMKDLKGKGSMSMKELMNSSNADLGNMKMKGMENFKGLNIGGQGESEKLKVGASTKAAMMESKVTAANVTMKEKGLKALTDMQESGNATMGILQQQWVDKAWKTSIQTQESFNAILQGMAKFIENSGVSGVDKPSTFEIIGNTGGSINEGGTGKKPVTGGHVDNRRKGGIDKFASGGRNAQPPTGGVAQGTTRVYGEVPGTTEFYITDNPRYRDRNMELLMAANQHMLRNARGNELRFAAGGALPPKGNFSQASSSGVRYNASSGASSLASQGAAMWKGLVKAGGGNVNVIIAELGGNLRGLTYSDGTIKLDPQATKIAAAHEFGHTLGLGHGGDSIMGGAGYVTANDFKALETYYGMSPGGSSGGGSTSPSDSPSGGSIQGGSSGSPTSGGSSNNIIISQNQSGPGAQSSKVGGNANVGKILGGLFGRNAKKGKRGGGGGLGGMLGGILGGSRRRRRKKGRRRDSGGILGGLFGGGLLGGLRMATGGILETGGMYTQPKQNLLAAERAQMLMNGEHRHARGGVHTSHHVPVRNGEARLLGGTTMNFGELSGRISKDIVSHVSGISRNTYVGHPGGEQNSVDYWGGARGTPIGEAKGNEALDYSLSKHKKDIGYYIWRGQITGWGSTKPYSDKSDPHYDHLHQTYSAGANLSGADTSGSTTDYSAMYDKDVPMMNASINYGKVGEAAIKRGNEIRAKHKAMMMKKTGDGGTAPEWTGEGSLDDWIKQGTVYGNVFEPSGGNLSSLKGRAMQESGGDPNAVNDWDSTRLLYAF
jgi:hypothetical protein